MTPEALGVRAKDLIPNFSTQELAWSSLPGGSWEWVKSIHRSTTYPPPHETVMVVTPWRVLGVGEIHTQEHHLPPHETVMVVTPWRVLGGGESHTQEHHLPPPPRDCWLYEDFILRTFVLFEDHLKRTTPRPHQVAFTT